MSCTAARMLLKSWAMPPARRPTDSIFRPCSRRSRVSAWARSASASRVMSMKAMTTWLMPPRSSGIGFAWARTFTFRPSCRWMTMSSTVTVVRSSSARTNGIRPSGYGFPSFPQMPYGPAYPPTSTSSRAAMPMISAKSRLA